jgi:RNA polymerase sigma-70 factor (ECF subfamily)
VSPEALAEEAELIRLAQEDPSAFSPFYDRYHIAIRKFVNSRISDWEVADGMASEVFVRALRAIGRYRIGEFSIRSWLFTIANNLVMDYYRNPRRREVTHRGIDAGLLYAVGSDVEERALAALECGVVFTHLAAIAPRQAKAIRLKFLGDLKYAEIAERMGTTEGAVKILVHRGLAALRARMTELEEAC